MGNKQQNDTYVVYKHVNKINDKIYVGITCQKLNYRWKNGKGYEDYTILPNGEKKPSHFWASICKYGWNNFEHKVLIHGLTKSQADFWEKKLIKEWDLMNPEKGYNKKEGGSNGKPSNETREKLRQAILGKKHSDETKNKLSLIFKGCTNPKISESLKEYYKTHDGTMKGKSFSEESKQKMRLAKLGKSSPHKGIKLNDKRLKKLRENSLNCKKIVCVNNLTIYVSQTRACDCLNISNKHVGDVCQGRRPHTYGYKFMYYTDFIEKYPDLKDKLIEDNYCITT